MSSLDGALKPIPFEDMIAILGPLLHKDWMNGDLRQELEKRAYFDERGWVTPEYNGVLTVKALAPKFQTTLKEIYDREGVIRPVYYDPDEKTFLAYKQPPQEEVESPKKPQALASVFFEKDVVTGKTVMTITLGPYGGKMPFG